MTFNLNSFWQSEADEHMSVAQQTFATLQPDFEKLLNICVQAVENGNKIILFGNGGSAADAQHLATELTIRYRDNRAPIAAIALTTDTSAITACGNDLGFDQIFARQLQAIGKAGDIAIGISTSGNSVNVIEAFKTARTMGITTATFTGKTGGKIPEYSDITLKVTSTTTARIQEMHITLGQMLCGALELKLGLI